MTTFGFIGTGTMTSAIVRGAVGSGFVAPDSVHLYNLHAAKAHALAQAVGGAHVEGSARALAAASDVVIIGVKPAVVPTVLPELGAALAENGASVISIAAGLSTQRLHELLGAAGAAVPVIRVMPNVAATIGASMSAVTAGPNATEQDVATATALFEAVGDVVQIAEKDFSAFTALAGSSPAFTFQYIEALARAGVEAGLRKDVATRIAAQAVLGSARLLLATGTHPAALVDQVSSPGGTTVAGLLAMEERGFAAAVTAGVRATIGRDAALATGA